MIISIGASNSDMWLGIPPLLYSAALSPQLAFTIMNIRFLNLPIVERVQSCKATLVSILFSIATFELAVSMINIFVLALIFNCKNSPYDRCLDGLVVLFGGIIPAFILGVMYI